jgi:DUF1707 SHOCT-like domain/2TM domain
VDCVRQADSGHIDLEALTSRLRVSDLDRELAARRLRDAASAGVLTVTELDWRLHRVLSAATRGQLEAELLDLPAPPRIHRSRVHVWLRVHVRLYAIVNGGMTAIWAAAGFGDFWPVWPMIGWGMVLASHACCAWGLMAGGELSADP